MTEVVARRRGRPARPPVPAKPETADVEVNYTSETPENEPISARPAMRPAMREDDPRAAAARRAAEIRGHIGNMDEGTDDFRAPRPPEGWEYEWKRRTVMGQEDPAYQVQLARMGWEAVPTSRHPEMMPHAGSHPNIERKGQVLMMRPAVISEEARDIEKRKARAQVKHKEQQLHATPEGTMTRDDPRVRPTISKGYEPIPVPKD